MIGTKLISNYRKSGGFTLVELIVVMAVFLMIIGAAMGIFISIIQHQRRILSEQELLNQASYVEEYMSKAIRMATRDISGNCLVDDSLPTSPYYPGYNYILTRPVEGYFTGIKFLNQSNTDYLGNPICQEFYLDTTVTPHILYSKISGEDATALSGQKLNIDSIRFGIDGTNGSFPSPIGDQDIGFDELQPRITIFMNIQIPGDEQQPTRTIQTTVSQRNLNAQ